MRVHWPLAVVASISMVACAPRQPILQVPEFKVQSVALRSLTLPGLGRPAVATLSVQLRVHNPNPVSVRVARAGGRILLDDLDVGTVNLPNVDLPAGGDATQEAVVDLPVTLANLATFVKVGRGEAVPYRLEGSFTVDAGLLGKPTFGPYVVAQGVLKQPRILP